MLRTSDGTIDLLQPLGVALSHQHHRMTSSLIFTTVYGYHIATNNDPYVAAAEEFMATSSYTVTAGWAVDLLPFCQLLPSERKYR